MTERPIIFSGETVRAILDGRKTQTRRVVKPQPDYVQELQDGQFETSPDGGFDHGVSYIHCPYGKPGDRLWVKEAFYVDHFDYSEGGRLPKEPGNELRDTLYYSADGECCQQIPECQCPEIGKTKWRNPRFMPRWASRITLEISGVRVERLQDISFADVNAEGLDTRDRFTSWAVPFIGLWDKINGKKAPWASNPFVWVIEFRRK